MPPKRGKDAGGATADELRDEEGLQVLILADTGCDASLWGPADGGACAALRPLAGVPALEYTLAWLASQTGVAAVTDVRSLDTSRQLRSCLLFAEIAASPRVP